MTASEDARNDCERVRQWIADYINDPSITETWSDLFRRANVSLGTMSKIREGDFKNKPTPATILKIANAMGRTPQEGMVMAGYMDIVDESILRTQDEYDLTPNEARLIDMYRLIGEHDKHQREKYQPVAYEAVRGLAEAGGMQ
jgi:transcriptional regulator with XRE-family HTH domain